MYGTVKEDFLTVSTKIAGRVFNTLHEPDAALALLLSTNLVILLVLAQPVPLALPQLSLPHQPLVRTLPVIP